MNFLTFLEKYEKEDVSQVKRVVESNNKKEAKIIRESLSGRFPSKKEALFNLSNYFTEKGLAPEGIDVAYVNANFDRLRNKIESLTEGDIRIIIHNHEGKKGETPVPDMEFEEESVEKKRRGRPKKMVTGVVYDEPRFATELGEEEEEEVIDVKTDAELDKPMDADEEDEEDLLRELVELDLSDDELKNASEMAEKGEISEEDDKLTKAASIISKINSKN